MQLKSIAVAALRPSPGNRTMLGIPELAASIQRAGRMLQPPVVTDQGDGSFLIVAGHRRIAAATILGWKHVDCSVVETTEPDLLRAVENMAREDPLPHELVTQVAALLEKYDKKTVCRATGYSAPHIKNLERVKTHLCPEAWAVFVAQGRKAKISDWFTIAGMLPARQKSVLFGDPANPIKANPEGPKRPRKGQVMAEYNRLPAEHPGAAWLGWVLGTREKPRWLQHRSARKVAILFSRSRLESLYHHSTILAYVLPQPLIVARANDSCHHVFSTQGETKMADAQKPGGIAYLRTQMARAKATAQKVREKGDHVMDVAFSAGEVAIAAGAIGAAEGWSGGDISVAGVPLEWAGALAGHGYGLLSGTRHAQHVHSLANGALAVGAYKAGKKLGEKAKKNRDTKGSIFGEGDAPAGALPAGNARFYGPQTTSIVQAS